MNVDKSHAAVVYQKNTSTDQEKAPSKKVVQANTNDVHVPSNPFQPHLSPKNTQDVFRPTTEPPKYNQTIEEWEEKTKNSDLKFG